MQGSLCVRQGEQGEGGGGGKDESKRGGASCNAWVHILHVAWLKQRVGGVEG